MKVGSHPSSRYARGINGFSASYEAFLCLIILLLLMGLFGMSTPPEGRVLLLQQTEDLGEVMARSPEARDALKDWLVHDDQRIADVMSGVVDEMGLCLLLEKVGGSILIGDGCGSVGDYVSVEREYWFDGLVKVRILCWRR